VKRYDAKMTIHHSRVTCFPTYSRAWKQKQNLLPSSRSRSG